MGDIQGCNKGENNFVLCLVQYKVKKQTQEKRIESIQKIDHQYAMVPTPELYREKLSLNPCVLFICGLHSGCFGSPET